jgi:serine/threonine protein kinase
MLENGTVVFDHWVVEDKIGSGAFGTVYKIKREEYGKEYRSALKVITIPPENSDILNLKSEGMTKEEISAYYSDIALSFMEEIKLLEELKGNSNIVSYEDHIIQRSEDGMEYTIMIKMELLTPLKNVLAERQLSPEEVMKLGMDICTALEVCEAKKIIHRDIKPDNIFVSDTGAYKLGDFGVARTLEKTVGVMSQKGTYTYMAPEVFLGKEYNQNVDLYSLGILLYQLLNKNRTPFLPPAPQPLKYSDREEAQKKRMSGNLLPWISGLPDSWNGLLVKMCHPNPQIRFQNAIDVRKQINSALTMGRNYSLATGMGGVASANVPANNGMGASPVQRVQNTAQVIPTQTAVKPAQAQFSSTHTTVAPVQTQATPVQTQVTPVQKQVTMSQIMGTPNQANIPPVQTAETPVQSKKSKAPVIIIIMLILLIVAGVVAFLVLNADNDESDKSDRKKRKTTESTEEYGGYYDDTTDDTTDEVTVTVPATTEETKPITTEPPTTAAPVTVIVTVPVTTPPTVAPTVPPTYAPVTQAPPVVTTEAPYTGGGYIAADTSSINIAVGEETAVLIYAYGNLPYDYDFNVKYPSNTTVRWGAWESDGKSCYLYITGVMKGSSYATVELRLKDGTLISSYNISVNVK